MLESGGGGGSDSGGASGNRGDCSVLGAVCTVGGERWTWTCFHSLSGSRY